MKIVYMEEFVRRGVEEVMREAKAVVGDRPTFVSFDIDCIDPSMAPGTGTPEIGGFSTREVQAMIRFLDGVSTSSGPMSSRFRLRSTSAD